MDAVDVHPPEARQRPGTADSARPDGAAARPPSTAEPPLPALRRAGILQSAAALLWVPQALLIARTVDGMAAGSGMAGASAAAALVLVLGLLRALLGAAGGRLAFKAARDALGRLRGDAAAALSARPPLDPGRPASGAAGSVLAEQAEAVLPYLQHYHPVRLRVALVPPVLLLAVAAVSWAAAVILLVAAPLIPLFMALIGLRAKEASEAQLLEISTMNGLLLDRLRGLPTIRALDAVDATAGRLRAMAETVRRRTMAVLRIAFLSSAVLELFAALGVAMVAVYVGFHLLGTLAFGAWGGPMALSQALFVLLLAPAFFEPLRELASVWHDRAAGRAALDALARLGTDGATTPDDVPAAPRPPRHPIGLVIEDLTFRYPGSASPVLAGFDLRVAPGERIALFGPSGSGKSTVLALVAGLATHEAGRIVVDGEPVTPATAARLRRRIAWVGHRPHFVEGTLRANVAFGRAGLDPLGPLDALLPGQDPQRRVGEAGFGLSGGEALRLAVARAVADPEARLILADEPTAHLDADSAERVVEALLSVAGDRTLVVATHDPRLAARLDRVVGLGP